MAFGEVGVDPFEGGVPRGRRTERPAEEAATINFPAAMVPGFRLTRITERIETGMVATAAQKRTR